MISAGAERAEPQASRGDCAGNVERGGQGPCRNVAPHALRSHGHHCRGNMRTATMRGSIPGNMHVHLDQARCFVPCVGKANCERAFASVPDSRQAAPCRPPAPEGPEHQERPGCRARGVGARGTPTPQGSLPTTYENASAGIRLIRFL
jgi:hypothetical protein